jgi:hypothetical protein
LRTHFRLQIGQDGLSLLFANRSAGISILSIKLLELLVDLVESFLGWFFRRWLGFDNDGDVGWPVQGQRLRHQELAGPPVLQL